MMSIEERLNNFRQLAEDCTTHPVLKDVYQWLTEPYSPECFLASAVSTLDDLERGRATLIAVEEHLRMVSRSAIDHVIGLSKMIDTSRRLRDDVARVLDKESDDE